MLRGALAAAVTPLADNRLDEEAIGPYVDFLAGAGLDGLLALGTTGEGLLFDLGERRRAVELFVGPRPVAFRSLRIAARRRRQGRSSSPSTRLQRESTPSR